MNFFKKLQEETIDCKKALYNVPQIVEALQGKISKESYLYYLEQAYHHVKHTLPLLMAAGSRMPENMKWLQHAFAKYIEEETGHEQWILNDIKNSGGSVKNTINSTPSLPVELMVSYAYDLVNRKNPVAFLGMVYVLEGTSIELATSAAEAIAKSLKLKKDSFSYLLSHGSLDLKHMQFFETVINQVSDKKDQQEIIHTAKVIFYLFTEMFKTIPHNNISKSRS